MSPTAYQLCFSHIKWIWLSHTPNKYVFCEKREKTYWGKAQFFGLYNRFLLYKEKGWVMMSRKQAMLLCIALRSVVAFASVSAECWLFRNCHLKDVKTKTDKCNQMGWLYGWLRKGCGGSCIQAVTGSSVRPVQLRDSQVLGKTFPWRTPAPSTSQSGEY